MKNIVLEDVGEFTQVQFQYFSVHYVFRFSPEKTKKQMSSVYHKRSYSSSWRGIGLEGGGEGALFWSVCPPLLFSNLT